MVTVGVLALQGGVREHERMLEALGARTVLLRRAGQLDGIDGVVIPGGESSTIDRLLRTFGLFEPLRAALTQGLPVLGTCAGLITLATEIEDRAPGQRSLGVIDMRVRRNAFGRQVNSAVERIDTAFGPVEAAYIRAPEVVAVGDGVDVVAKKGERVVGVETPSALAVSFHPELTGDTTIHAHFLGKLTR
ncbi:5'-phosphate synthase pdxT subunit [Corynebacterium mycetoides]|uniref:Pyridoxal 5'-phosphate synthase subunit PdxT n=1 Tax=Corynebacterium mycetoides TaxID=38302 RepID=A0A1G9MBQ8_9CORY|nr:pyridoxal 5'-phosphate synthase glutaminase subunit PdxT [Corynebacterium mycetoides]SDL71564.1 5'-phosphate synthase pdxT subunit [Corynebacterium mycetoides]